MRERESTAERVARKRHERSFSYKASQAYSEVDATMKHYFPKAWKVVKGIAIGTAVFLMMGFSGGMA